MEISKKDWRKPNGFGTWSMGVLCYLIGRIAFVLEPIVNTIFNSWFESLIGVQWGSHPRELHVNSPSGYQKCKAKEKTEGVLKALSETQNQRLRLIGGGSMDPNHFTWADMLDQSHVSILWNGFKGRKHSTVKMRSKSDLWPQSILQAILAQVKLWFQITKEG